ncbi:Beta-ketoacyl-acyl synthase N-terminal domain-containing protein [Desulfonema limicola]|uniref:Beta-ketoacyl-acyl synthase N-terminal domain-containing protein n=1 Tax=Desulfonema limicola TaxID=45656 RepID=A0A975B7H3_9BACT|nr:beta-ketoacyl synthase N-terminal-like domain-containing protein [Desulfonema limicola]QTA80117.1 Beta-ketoacyl-acyl synthase N-terminal domain-containing protein [Desulfonema limicola]
MKIGIKGIGLAGGFGCGISEFEQALDRDRSEAHTVSIETVKGKIEVPGLTADTSRLKDFINPKNLRRIDHYTQMALLACVLALEDAGLWKARPAKSMGIIMGTGYGSTCNTFDFQDLTTDNNICGFSPIQFSNSVHNAAAAHISAFLNEKGPNLSINQFDMSPCCAFMTAINWLAEERVENVLVGLCDDFSKIMACHQYFLSLNDNTWNIPVGEGSVFFLLTKDETSFCPYGYIKDAGTGSFDSMPENADYILNFDRLVNDRIRSVFSREIKKALENKNISSFEHIYGSMPVNMGFDIAAAGLSIKTGKGWKSLPGFNSGIREICCLKAGVSGEYGLICLSSN